MKIRILTLCLCQCLGAAENYSTWPHSKTLFFDTSPDGANLANPVRNFPVLLRLRSSELDFSQTRSGGKDIRFAKPDGTPLEFEIERFDSAGGRAEIWIRMDTVKAAFKGAFATMYWGGDTASVSSGNKVFPAADGFVDVWHMGGIYPTPRRNAVAGGADLVPQYYDNDENSEGIIAWADSLDGAASGDFLQTWERFDNLNSGFTYSVWAFPTSVAAWERLMDFGNGGGVDEIYLARENTSQNLVFEIVNNPAKSTLVVPNAIALNEWQHFAVTVAGKEARIYRNGALMGAGTLTDTLSAVYRAVNYIGKSHWGADAFYQGKLDEPVVSKVARGADWLRLAYANQKSNQTLVHFTKPVPADTCRKSFSVPGDTSLPEAGSLSLSAKADCASGYAWSVVEGPGGRLLDPEVKSLDLILPRVAGDTQIVYRFTAIFPDSTRSQSIRVSIRETIPDPVFTLPLVPEWSGADSLVITPIVSNLAAIKASSEPVLHSVWTLSGSELDSASREGSLVLKAPRVKGDLAIGLCLDNHGPATCRSIVVKVTGAVSLWNRVREKPSDNRVRYDSRGRRLRLEERARQHGIFSR